MVAERYQVAVSDGVIGELYSIEKLPAGLSLKAYDGVIIGFPVIHTHPSVRMLRFIEALKPFESPVPACIFCTCGLYSANTLRIFSKACLTKNILPVCTYSYRCAASDGMLLAPFIPVLATHEKGLESKILRHCRSFADMLELGDFKAALPRFKLYSILNYPNKLAGTMVTFPIYLHREPCIRCGRCIANCPSHALSRGDDGYPLFNSKQCEKCYRCIHYCPQKALSLSKHSTPRTVLSEIHRDFDVL